jgi:purine-binding chemotaxis protein CheW
MSEPLLSKGKKEEQSAELNRNSSQFTTFIVSGRLYGIDVQSVQEVTKSLLITSVPLAPNYIHGLINLRGQIATAVSLRELFELKDPPPSEFMNVVCRLDGVLISLLVDQIGDVIELNQSSFEPTPDTVSVKVARFMDGIYKIPGQLLSIIDVNKILEVLNH